MLEHVVCWELLAGDAAPHNVFRVSHGGRPVEPCSKSFGYKCATARVVPVDALVNFKQEGFAVFLVDAFLKDWEMLRLWSCLLITVNDLDRRLMRRASATSCGRVPSIRNRRNGFS